MQDDARADPLLVEATIARARVPATHAASETLRPLLAPRAPAPELTATSELPVFSVTDRGKRAPVPALDPADTPEQLVLQGVLGQGGMGKVYLAVQRSLGRKVALKVLEGEGGGPESLLREARVTGGLEHPNIVPVHLLGLDAGGKPAMVMKRIEGVSWTTLLREPGHEAWGRLAVRHPEALGTHLEVLLQVCHAVQYAHARGVVHRDLKPDNVMVGEHGEVYLLDWGIALRLDEREGEADALVGTPAYMAPEMVDARAALVDERTDVYLLGAVLHEVLTGGPRHEGETLSEVLLSALQSHPVLYEAAVPEALAALCNEATARDATKRPATVALFRQRVHEHMLRRPSLALSASADERLERAVALPEGVEARRLLAECRFAYLQALSEWGGNMAARAGLQRAVGRLVELELAQKNLASARGLLPELPAPEPALELRVEALAAALEDEARRARADEQRRYEMDASVAQRERGRLMRGVIVLGMPMIALYASRQLRTGATPAPGELVVFDSSFFLGALVVLAVARRRLLANVISRRLTGVLLSSMGALLVVDLFGWHVGARVQVTTPLKMVLCAAVLATSASMGLRALALPAALVFAGATLGLALPRQLSTVILVTSLSTIASLVQLQRRGLLRIAGPDDER